MTLRERFLRRVTPEPNTGCWLWFGNSDAHGYGRLRVGGNDRHYLRAHRVSFALHVRDPGPGLVLHRCDVPWCVNPDHLYVGTDLDNMRDRAARRRNPMQKHSLLFRPDGSRRAITAMLAARGIAWPER